MSKTPQAYFKKGLLLFQPELPLTPPCPSAEAKRIVFVAELPRVRKHEAVAHWREEGNEVAVAAVARHDVVVGQRAVAGPVSAEPGSENAIELHVMEEEEWVVRGAARGGERAVERIVHAIVHHKVVVVVVSLTGSFNGV